MAGLREIQGRKGKRYPLFSKTLLSVSFVEMVPETCLRMKGRVSIPHHQRKYKGFPGGFLPEKGKFCLLSPVLTKSAPLFPEWADSPDAAGTVPVRRSSSGP